LICSSHIQTELLNYPEMCYSFHGLIQIKYVKIYLEELSIM